MSEKIKIQKNSVQETLLIPLYARVQCTKLYPKLYSDPLSEKALDRIDYDFSSVKNSGFAVKFGALEIAMRESDITTEVKKYLHSHPRASVVNLGCGLDPLSRNIDNGKCKIYNLDYPDVIEVRNQILPAGDRETNIPCDLNDTSWFKKIDRLNGVIFFACGVFYYFKKEEVQALFCAMNERFPGCRLVFDSAGKMALKMMIKGIVQKETGIQNVDAYFHAGNPKEDILPWSNGFRVSSKGYMLGYQNLWKVKGISIFYRLLSQVCDSIMKMKIIRIDFKS